MSRRRTAYAVTCLWAGFLAAGALPAFGQWTQWGGPDRNFVVQTTGLDDKWPADGPPRLWSRELGDGFSTILCDAGTLYTMYRVGEDEFTIALDAATGQTRWEHRQSSPFTPNMAEYGPGPHSTPLIVDDQLFSIGTNLMLHCFDKTSGRILWKHDLVSELGASVPSYGYTTSPLAYKKTVILTLPHGDAAGRGPSLIAFDQATGRSTWQSLPLTHLISKQSEYSSPIIINFAGEDQLVFFTNEVLVGLRPDSGEVLWRQPHLSRTGVNVTTPIWNGSDLLFCSSAYDSGARAIRLRRESPRTIPEELWYNRKMRMHHGNAVLIGDYVYGSSGDFGPAFFAALNIHTGEMAWRERGFRKATCVYGDGKLIILDEDGTLALTKATPKGLKILSQCHVTQRCSWTTPTLVGQTLYVRDRHHIMALDLH